MKNYWISIYHPENYCPQEVEGESMRREIDALNEEMLAAGVRVFVGGLQAALQAKSVVRINGSSIVISDGPYLQTKEHVGGFWVLRLSSPEEAVEWGRKAARACRAPVEIRQFNE